MKIKGKLMITVFLITTMFLGSVFNVNASESHNNELEDLSYNGIKLEADGYYHYEIYSRPYFTDINNYEYHYTHFKSKQPLAIALSSTFTSSGYEFSSYSVLNNSKFGLINIPVNGISYEYSVVSAFQRKYLKGVMTQLDYPTDSFVVSSLNINDTTNGYFTTNIPVFGSREAANRYLDTLDESEVTNNQPIFSEGEYDSSLDFINLRYKQLSGTPKSHQIYWDENSNYDSNTWITVECDIKWRPLFGSLNQVSGWPYVKQGELLANTNSFTCLVTEPWKKYFEANAIDWSVFNTQWVDCFYLQVIKYHPDTDTWTKSNVLFINPAAQTTGATPIYGWGTAEKNPETGEFIKKPIGIGDANTGEPISGVIDDIYDGLGDIEVKDFPSYLAALGKAFITGFKSLQSSLGEIPAMVSSVISFLPGTIVTLIGFGIIIAIVLRIIGR